MKHIRWQALIALTGIAFLGVVFAVLAFGASTVERADYGGTYVEGVAGRPNALNPIFSQYNEVDRDITALVFSGLTRADENGNIKPDLATKWSIAPSGLIYTFTLRSDVYWHDGEHFDADDVLYTLHTIQDPACKCPPDLAGFWRTVAISAPDATTIRFQLTQPYAPFLDYTRIGILPAHLLKEVAPGDLLQHPFNRKPTGTGPFQIAELTAQHVLLDANPRYYGARPYLGRVQLKFYPDSETIFAAYAREDVSGIARILPNYLKKAQEQPQLKLYNARIGGYALVLFNLSKFQFQDKNVRQALLYATDRKRLIDEQLQGQGVIASSPIEPGSWAHNALINPYAFDLDKAKVLLDGAGWRDSDGDGTRDKDRQSLAFALTTSDDPQRVAIANALAKNWQTLGVKVTVQAVPASLLVQNILRPRQFDAVLYEWRTLSNDPDQYENWHETQIPDAARAGQNYAGLKDRDISETLEAARRTSDLGKRAELYRKFQELFADRVPALLLYYPIYSYGIDARVRDVQLAPLLTPSDRFRSIAQWYLKTKRVPPDATEEPTRTRVIPTSAPMTATPTLAPATAAPTVSGTATPLVVVVVATPAPASTIDAGQCAASSAIKSPAMNAQVSGLYEIRGTATHPNLGHWKLELRADATPTYTQLFRSDQPVNDQVLSVWSTRAVPNGVYWLQLVVVDNAGNTGTPCQIRVSVAN